MGRLVFLLPILAWGQAPTNVVDGSGTPVKAEVRLYPTTDPRWNIAAIQELGFRQAVRATELGQETNLGTVEIEVEVFGGLIIQSVDDPTPLPKPRTEVLTVCEALEERERLHPIDYVTVVIVGIFKSGLDETLRQDCPNQLVTGDIGWMSAIALTRPTAPPESLRAAIEKKRQIILNSGPPGAHPRPERVVALYGRLVSPSGLTSIPCCTAPVEINAAPARLLGLDERDFRVLR